MNSIEKFHLLAKRNLSLPFCVFLKLQIFRGVRLVIFRHLNWQPRFTIRRWASMMLRQDLNKSNVLTCCYLQIICVILKRLTSLRSRRSPVKSSRQRRRARWAFVSHLSTSFILYFNLFVSQIRLSSNYQFCSLISMMFRPICNHCQLFSRIFINYLRFHLWRWTLQSKKLKSNQRLNPRRRCVCSHFFPF